jgi:hypothetical protein
MRRPLLSILHRAADARSRCRYVVFRVCTVPRRIELAPRALRLSRLLAVASSEVLVSEEPRRLLTFVHDGLNSRTRPCGPPHRLWAAGHRIY